MNWSVSKNALKVYSFRSQIRGNCSDYNMFWRSEQKHCQRETCLAASENINTCPDFICPQLTPKTIGLNATTTGGFGGSGNAYFSSCLGEAWGVVSPERDFPCYCRLERVADWGQPRSLENISPAKLCLWCHAVSPTWRWSAHIFRVPSCFRVTDISER